MKQKKRRRLLTAACGVQCRAYERDDWCAPADAEARLRQFRHELRRETRRIVVRIGAQDSVVRIIPLRSVDGRGQLK